MPFLDPVTPRLCPFDLRPQDVPPAKLRFVQAEKKSSWFEFNVKLIDYLGIIQGRSVGFPTKQRQPSSEDKVPAAESRSPSRNMSRMLSSLVLRISKTPFTRCHALGWKYDRNLRWLAETTGYCAEMWCTGEGTQVLSNGVLRTTGIRGSNGEVEGDRRKFRNQETDWTLCNGFALRESGLVQNRRMGIKPDRPLLPLRFNVLLRRYIYSDAPVLFVKAVEREDSPHRVFCKLAGKAPGAESAAVCWPWDLIMAMVQKKKKRKTEEGGV
ncbi:hypothetical protein DFH06DRAFT_1122957 [Mycena polygramma]|nr:hypothetical protein DFH06DRAFT_1122957 [Mycena polygramma]